VLIPAYAKRKLYFEACKAQRRHPVTKEPLTAADFKATPWLFPEDEKLLGCKREGQGIKIEIDSSDDEDPSESESEY
jgi:hypothetical protein